MAPVNVLEEGSNALKNGDKNKLESILKRLRKEMRSQADRRKKCIVSRNDEVQWCLELVGDKELHKMIPLRYVKFTLKKQLSIYFFPCEWLIIKRESSLSIAARLV